MNDRYNLTRGPIMKQLILVSIPVMFTSLMQMAYSFIDMILLGYKVSTESLASAGFGGFFAWLGAAVYLLVKIGTEVRVAQEIGKGNFNNAKKYAKNGVQLGLIFAFIYAVILLVLADQLIGLFPIEEAVVHNDAVIYLRILSIGMIFFLINPVLSATLNGTGNTLTPFLISGTGLILNIILDILFIMVLEFGISGAAIATIISQFIVTLIFILYSIYKDNILSKANYFTMIDFHKAKDIIRLGLPVAVQSALFTFIAMVIAGFVTPYGSDANAAQKVGQNIEALSWLTASGLQTALGAFVGQNYGANKLDRVMRAVKYSLFVMTIYGVIVSLLLYFLAKPLFFLILPDYDTLPLGIDYLKILAFSQLFMIIELLIAGAFNGLGKTHYPSIVSIFFNVMRIVMALLFMPHFGLNGIWLAITISSIFKGTVLLIWFMVYVKRDRRFQLDLSNELISDTI